MSPTSEFSDRQHPDTIVLFDVDGTLTPARNVSRKHSHAPFASDFDLIYFLVRFSRDEGYFGSSSQEGCYWLCRWF
jgi:hypothetical protein